MVRHFLKNGKQVRDIKGHIVKINDASAIYALMDRINQKVERESNGNNSQQKSNR